MRRKKARKGTPGHDLANSTRTPQVDHLCALLERLERELRRAEKVPTLLTLDEVATCLQVSRRTVYRIVAAGLLQTVRVGLVMRVHPDELNDFYRRQRRLDGAVAGAGGGQKVTAACS